MVWWNRKPVDGIIRRNRDQFFEKQGIHPSRVVSAGLIHGTRVANVGEREAGEYLLDTDALITNTANLFLAVTAADCMPVFFYDPVTKSVGIAHAGWRGTVGGILEKVAGAMGRSFGTNPKDIAVAIGPHIQSHHYEISGEVALNFDENNIERKDGRLFANLAGEAAMRLRRAGVQDISVDLACTFCSAGRFFSARHDRVESLQGMVAYIGLGR